jgi:hypothetical protein
MAEFRTDATILKVSTELGLIFGWAMICKVADENGDFYDSDGEHFEEQAMLEAVTDFAKSKRVACDMHARDGNKQPIQDGAVIHHFPLTSEIAKALGIITPYSGLLIAMAPDSPELLEKAKNGEYTGFSIGGEYLEVIDE